LETNTGKNGHLGFAQTFASIMINVKTNMFKMCSKEVKKSYHLSIFMIEIRLIDQKHLFLIKFIVFNQE
jgi:hypothetical protein